MKKKRNTIPELPADCKSVAFAPGGWFALARGIGGKVVPEALEDKAPKPTETHNPTETHIPPDSAIPVQMQSDCVNDTCSGIRETDFMLPAPAGPPALLAFPSPAQAAETSPEDLQPVFARELQRKIAEGLPDIPAPRTVKELASMVGIWRGLARLDKQETAGPAVLVAPMRSVQRRRVGPVVDVGEAGE